MSDQILKHITKYNLIIGPLYVVASLLFWSFPRTLGVTLGAAIMMLNFYLMVFLIKRAFGGGKIDPMPFVLYLVKVLILFGIVYYVFKWELVDKIFFLAGTSAIIVSLVLAGFSSGKLQKNTQ